MITNNDFKIENTSYTNKDFGTIYPELLDLIQKLTNRWDPSQANESDPGIVLVKLMAFLGDKLNYNIDKNILEAFITSATQESSVRKITEMLGYNMHYYRSATSKLSFKYTGWFGSTDESDSGTVASVNSFTIKAFDTSFSTENDVVYTLLEDISVVKGSSIVTNKQIMQGELKQLTVIGSNSEDTNLIQLINLDDNNRLYFPDSNVAENGIFINKEVYNSVYNKDAWHRVDSLYDQELRQNIFKFGYDSSIGFPYIEFPEDISDLIGKGFEVYYLTTLGSYGDIKANELTKFTTVSITSPELSESLSSLDDTVFSLSNTLSVSGEDKETINEVYNNYKRTVNTFNTLVSCKDYSNYLNRYVSDDDSSKLVSNCQVTDIRIDPQYSQEIFTRDSNGNSFYDIVVKDTTPLADYYNIAIHGTVPVNQTITTKNLYEKTYSALNSSNIENIKSALDEVKTINHNLVLPTVNTLNYVEADHILSCNLSTTTKLSTSEQSEVIENVKKALYSSFNSQQLEFGESIPFDSILEVISNADTRIKNVSLNEPEIKYYLNYAQGSKPSKSEYSPLTHVDIIIDNILAGRMPIYYKDTTISYTYDMDLNKGSYIANEYLKGIKANFSVKGDNYKLKTNEQISLVKDSYICTTSYPAYVYYAFVDTATAAGTLTIKKNETYKLKDTQTLYIQYTDNSDIVQFKKYTGGQFIRPNFDIVNTSNLAYIDTSGVSVENTYASKYAYWDKKTVNNKMTYKLYEKLSEDEKAELTPLFSIGTSEQIDIMVKNSVIVERDTPVFWYVLPRLQADGTISNQRGDLILQQSPYDKNKYFYILEAGEYFIYSNEEKTSLNILGEGTKLIYSKPTITKSVENVIDVEDLVNTLAQEDILSFKNTYNWEYLAYDIEIVETVSTDYYEDSVVNSMSVDEINSNWQGCDSLTIDNEEAILNSDLNPIVRSLLNIISSAENPQEVLEDQEVYLFSSNIWEDSENEKAVITKTQIETGRFIQTSSSISTYNDLGIFAVIQYDEDGTKLIPKYDTEGNYLYQYNAVSSFIYKEIKVDEETGHTFTDNIQDFILWLKANNKLPDLNTRNEYQIAYSVIEEYFTTVLKGDDYILNLNYEFPDLYINFFDPMKGVNKLIELSSISKLDLNYIKEISGTIYISTINHLQVYSYITSVEGLIEAIKKKISSYTSFDIIGPLNENKYITSYTPLYSFLDSNNIYNKLTLSKIDFDNSSFNIVGGVKIW